VKGEEFKDDFRKALPREVVQRLTRRSPWRATSAVLHDLAVLALAIAVGLYFWPNPVVSQMTGRCSRSDIPIWSTANSFYQLPAFDP
jgi:hypothetical protein